VVSNKQKIKQHGFTVIEVLITLFVIAASLMIFQASSRTIILNRQSEYREIALRIADKKLQSIRTTPFANIPTSGSFSDPALSNLPDAQASLTVANTSDSLKDVTVTVTWTNPSANKTESINLQTIIMQGGIGQ
jgi:prepilin-type N-terminal cleavage/methylation domain-containing protein